MKEEWSFTDIIYEVGYCPSAAFTKRINNKVYFGYKFGKNSKGPQIEYLFDPVELEQMYPEIRKLHIKTIIDKSYKEVIND